MSVILIFSAFLLSFSTLTQRLSSRLDWRVILMLSAALLGVVLTILTETLSLFGHFEKSWLITTWAFINGILVVFLLKNWQKPEIKINLRGLSLLEWISLLGCGGICLVSGVIALQAAPNNWDSMVYHMSRVAHWVQNRSVNFYPTAIIRQLYLPPWSEYTIANLQILSGGDHLANLVQWFSMLGSLAGVSFISKKLGGSRKTQIFSATLAATLPMSILQSSTTQNDYVLTFWLVCLAAFILQYLEQASLPVLLGIGASLGLAALTKSTAFIFAFPLMLYFGLRGLKKYRLSFWKQTLIVSLFLLALNLPHFYRNYQTFDYPLGPKEEVARYHNAEYTPAILVSNLVRNIGLYAGSIDAINQPLNQAVEGLHKMIGLEVNDPLSTWEDHRFSISTPQINEDLTSSTFHFGLFLLALILLFIKRKSLKKKEALHFALLLIAAFIFFCGYLRWQQWHPRLHLPLFVLGCAFSGLLADFFKPRFTWLVSLVLLLCSLPVFYLNPSKPIFKDYNIFNLPRREVMILRKNLVSPYIDGVFYLAREKLCFQAGLYIPDEEWEYPIWSLYSEFDPPQRIEHVNVSNASAKIGYAPFEPCAIISTRPIEGDVFRLENGSEYRLDWAMDPIYIFTNE